MNLKLNKEKKIKFFFIIFSFIFSSILFINLFPKNQLLIDQNLFSEENVNNPNIAAKLESDWEIARGSGQIATINKPIATQEGDLLILHCTVDGQADPMTGPIGWNVLLPENNSVDPTTASWYKIAGDAEPINYTITWGTNEGYVAGVIRISGINKTNPIQATAATTGVGDVVNPSVNVTKNYTLIIGFHGLDREGPGDNYDGTFLETGPTVLYAKAAGVGNQGCCAGVFYELQTNQGIYTSRTWSTGGTEDWYAATVAINLILPIINITSPLENEIYGVISPNFIVEITDMYLNTTWYTVDGGINNYTFTENGTIHQAAWEALSDGVVNIKFYANNSLGYINFQQVNVTKNSAVPIINVISPVKDDAFGVTAPSFVVEITDSNLDTMWYSISNNTYQSLNITFSVNETINPTVWSILYDGGYTIRFYANNTLGNINFEAVNITKNSATPIINVISPVKDDAFGVTAPSFVVEITDSNLDTMWYSISNNTYQSLNITFSVNGTVDSMEWNILYDGGYTIRFYANNTLGNINFEAVSVTKNSATPIINIISPVMDDAFGVTAPSFVVEITDSNLDTMWYSISNNTYQSLDITFSVNGTINSTEWSFLYDGGYTIRFYANNTLGNINFEAVNITKDGSAPSISIISPVMDDTFGVTAPSFVVEITDSNLDTMWYSISNNTYQSLNITFAVNDTINLTEWSFLYDGGYTIRFYANDTLGNINFEAVNVTKSSAAPIINIISPVMDDTFGVTAPSYIVEITCTNLNTTWYTMDGGINNYMFTENGTILQAVWDLLPDGAVSLRFYANDTLGNINFQQLNIIKDGSAPIISILNPVMDDAIGANAPSFIVEITEINLDTIWYTMDGGINNYTFTENGTILQAAWDSLPDGVVTLRFYANDTLGNINFEVVNIIKDGSAPIISIVNPVTDEEFGVNAPSFIVEITEINLDTIWYTMDGGINNYTFTENGTILQGAWDSLPDGVVTLRFYANDTLGNINFEVVNIIKDGSAPIISILNPVTDDAFGVNAPSFVVEITDSNLDTMWYSISNNTYQSLNITFSANGTIDSTEWSILYDGVYTIRFYANNTLGNINFEEVNIIKDSSVLIISINSPVMDDIFGVNTPNFIVEITSTNLNTTWYTLDGGINNYTFTENGTILQAAWDSLPDGVVTLRFYANNTLGNIYFEEVNIIKDGSAPIISILNPVTDEVFGVNAPSFVVEITDSNLDTMWYSISNNTYQSLNITFSANGTIDSTEWSILYDGVYTFRFYANDTLGNINFEEVNIIKDGLTPIISIISPVKNDEFGVNAPNFIVEITDSNLDTMWYTVNNSAAKFIFTQDGVIDQSLWDALADGDVLLTFYANDTIGNLASEDIIIRKNIPSGPSQDITPIIILVSVIGGVAVAGLILGILIKKGKISLDKLSIEKPSTEKNPKEKTPEEKTLTEETLSDESLNEEPLDEESLTEESSTKDTLTEKEE